MAEDLHRASVHLQAQNPTAGYDGENATFLFSYYIPLALITSVCLTGNGLVIFSIQRHKSLRTPENFFLCSLACSDFMVGVVYPVYQISHINSQQIRNALGRWHVCVTLMTLTMFTLMQSSYTLLVITIIRYLAVQQPLTFPRRLTHKRALCIIVLVWILVLALSLGLYARPTPQNYTNNCRYESINIEGQIYVTCTFVFFVPFLIMMVMYSKMACVAKRQIKQIARECIPMQSYCGTSMDFRGYRFKKEFKLFITVGMLVGYFAIAWIPFLCFEFLYQNSDGKEDNKFFRVIARLLLYSNSAVNVLIYGGRQKEFQRAFKQDMCCKSAEQGKHAVVTPEDSMEARVRSEQPATRLYNRNNVHGNRHTQAMGLAMNDMQGPNSTKRCDGENG